jgi:predicted GNAT family N-acyltransferase
MTTGVMTAPAKGGAAEWDQFHQIDPSVAIARLPERWIEDFMALTVARIGTDTAPAEVVRRVHAHNPDTIWGIFTRNDEGSHRFAGYYSFLLLNVAGHKALLDRALDRTNPQQVFLADAGERPAAIYIWGIVAKRLTWIAGPAVAQQMAHLHSRLPIYTTLATEAGFKLGIESGYKPVTPEDNRLGGLFLSDRYLRAGAPRFRVVSVSRPDELAQAMAVRATVFMGEQLCPYTEEFDDNDYCATHLLGFVDGEPAATMRLRYFADWVKLERMAVLERFRATPIKNEIINFAFEIARRKGYRQCYGHSQKRLVPFWETFGFEVFPRNSEIRFSDHDYVEIWKRLEPHPAPLTMRTDPMVMIRPEGRWDQPGILEKSAARPATNPH